MEINNPAGRLLNILEEGKMIDSKMINRDAWKKLLCHPDDYDYLLIGRIGKVFALPDEIYKELTLVENNRINAYMSWTKNLESSLNACRLDRPWAEFINTITDQILNPLAMTSEFLSAQRPQFSVEKSELDKISSDSQALLDLIINSSLETNLKSYFIEQLRKIRHAIEEFKITGAAPVIEIVESTFGKFRTNKEAFEDSVNDEGLKHKFWDFMHKTAVVLTVVNGLNQLPNFNNDSTSNSKPFFLEDR
ncbi:hypothetical protein CYQ88_04585, partial [Hydrogenovibrio sp. SC-1]|uniref:hypothetical protein n=1 Tax=Hydrogenovibrio sp. SC-1 TaxID=2065820 RepID=UPI000CA821ED